MVVQVKPIETFVLKVQRPVMCAATTQQRLLVYSEDGKIPIRLIPDSGVLHDLLGNRFRAYFLCSLQSDGEMRIHKEVERS